VDPGVQEPSYAMTETESHEAEKAAARRRSTVREKVSFLSNVQTETAAPVTQSQPEPAPASSSTSIAEPAPQPAPAASATETQPRRAGWWSRRFGGGE
jgi:ribonuclease E